MSQPFVAFDRVYRIYGVGGEGVTALDDVKFQIEAGEFAALVGPSGAGKSTILNLAGGLLRPTVGTVWVGGRDLGRLSEGELTRYRRKTVGFVWQGTASNLVPYLTVRENVELPMLSLGVKSRPRRRRGEELLDVVGLGERARHLPWMLSGGEQQRAAVAVALANLPPLLLADEPTGELDSASADRVLAAFRDTCSRYGTAVLMATHDSIAAARADRILHVLDGRLWSGKAKAARLDARGRLAMPEEALVALGGPVVEMDIGEEEVRVRGKRGSRGN